ncbi:hypothetical protein Slin15195_G026480 [Septoria linicola]|uniref:Uncharacterized protein n=1 Tax=Septoria linicola TaxID=215465 RepID=A0A9Q9AK10_9PEZI|nr:hypothetical protein Slin15195_G026480 [Septoria linicola]
MPPVPDDSAYFDIKARAAEHLKMSSSIIRGIRSGNYDFDQVDKLIAQREHAIETIKAQQGGQRGSCPPTSFEGIIASVGSSVQPSSPTPANRRDSSVVQHAPAVKCNFNICAGCRPYFADRLWASFESTFTTQAGLTAADAQKLPIINADIARTIGLRPTSPSPPRTAPSHCSIDVTDGEVESDISVDWSVTNSGESDSGGSEPMDKSELFPCPGPLQCPVWSRSSGCAYENGSFDDGKRAENHGFANSITPEHSRSQLHHYTYVASSTPGASSTTASTVSLPATPTAPLIPLLPAEDTFDVALQKEVEKTGNARRGVCQSSTKRRKTEIGLRERDSKTSLESNSDGAGGVTITY